MSDLKPTKQVRDDLSVQALSGMMVPHGTSQPLVRMHDSRPVLAVFTFTYSGHDLKAGEVGRPRYWALADIVSGELLAEYDCTLEDFSNEPFDRRYSIRFDAGNATGAEYLNEAFAVLDEFRKGYAETGSLDVNAYARYFEMIVASIPPDYRVFYEELGSPQQLRTLSAG